MYGFFLMQTILFHNKKHYRSALLQNINHTSPKLRPGPYPAEPKQLLEIHLHVETATPDTIRSGASPTPQTGLLCALASHVALHIPTAKASEKFPFMFCQILHTQGVGDASVLQAGPR